MYLQTMKLVKLFQSWDPGKIHLTEILLIYVLPQLFAFQNVSL